MLKIGVQLKAAREARKITLETVAEKTKINKQFLLYLEDGQWDFLPQVYVRSMVRQFADIVGLNGELLIKNYEQLLQERQRLAPAPNS
ncbi:helix-turn-helix domain-containing protein [candidate division KSB1 bacterium]|nr:helix-turn-helix domain-containing protein [candidate division KSB1 bacterium]